MSHDEPFAGKTTDANWAYYLDTSGTYTPDLTATTTDPDLGADGEAVGWWHRNGHMIIGGMRFLFSGSGLDPGSGAYEPTLPFDADVTLLTTAGSVGAGSIIGSGFLRDNSTTGNNRYLLVQLVTAGRVRMPLGAGNASMTDSLPITPAADDRLSLNFAYLADSAGLPT